MIDLSSFTDVLVYAAQCHQQQRRKDRWGTPYIFHPIKVAELLIRAGVTDPNIIAAGLTHDVIEDTGVSAVELKERIGSTATEIVLECSDDKSLPKERRKQLQIEHALHASPGAKLVKLADKYANLSDLLGSPPVSWSETDIRGYAVWCYAVILAVGDVNPTFTALFDALLPQFGIDLNMNTEELQTQLQIYYKSICVSE